jgi:hypothetical protein
MQAQLPVRGHLASRTRRRLAFWMPARFSKLLALEHFSRPKVVEPGLAGLKTRRDRVACRTKVLRRVLTRRTVATSYMAALDAAS